MWDFWRTNWHCNSFFLQYFSFPCQYHSTIAPHSFIHLPPTLYNVSLPALQLPLSVSFHHCSTLIHSSTTHAVQCFSPSTSASPVSIIPPLLHTHSFIYHPRCIMFLSQYFSFPCQYHSTIALHSFIHPPLTLYNVSLPVFQFPCQYHSTIAPRSFTCHLPYIISVTDSVVKQTQFLGTTQIRVLRISGPSGKVPLEAKTTALPRFTQFVLITKSTPSGDWRKMYYAWDKR